MFVALRPKNIVRLLGWVLTYASAQSWCLYSAVPLGDQATSHIILTSLFV